MVQQPMSEKTAIKLSEGGKVATERSHQELKREQVESAKAAAIHNWLNSKICGKAC
jgi:hypothetical protein